MFQSSAATALTIKTGKKIEDAGQDSLELAEEEPQILMGFLFLLGFVCFFVC